MVVELLLFSGLAASAAGMTYHSIPRDRALIVM